MVAKLTDLFWRRRGTRESGCPLCTAGVSWTLGRVRPASVAQRDFPEADRFGAARIFAAASL